MIFNSTRENISQAVSPTKASNRLSWNWDSHNQRCFMLQSPENAIQHSNANDAASKLFS